ncbi:glycosyltransferase family 4 protein [Halostella salina]|uniref:glycosyltransferase family 4 protein n=1 Tax=Halostella salina TaxID=1547897 RepID=UPI001F0991D2|nr:glycosyltransferase family 4 protein [Halostella salina]
MLHYCSQTANALSRIADVSAIVGSGADRSLFKSDVTVEEFDFPRSVSELRPSVVRMWTRLYRRLSDRGVDVVHATILDPLIVPSLLALRGRRTVFTLHDVTDHPGERKLRKAITRSLLVRSVDRVVVHGEYNAAACEQRFGIGDRLVRINHGDYSFFRRYCDSALRYDDSLLFFGRIRPYKGVDTLLEANQHLAESVDEYSMIVAGNGPLDDENAADEHVTVRNEFIPNETVCELFSRCRAVVLPYREASQSGIVPIAYSFKKPVIATAVGGLPEVVDHGKTGLLVEPENPEELATACASLLKDADKAKTMGRNGYEFKNRHMDWKSIGERLLHEAYGE